MTITVDQDKYIEISVTNSPAHYYNTLEYSLIWIKNNHPDYIKSATVALLIFILLERKL
jgi:sugar (pentulose or hexulose) kinase